jgi:hypothetical protein
VATVSVDANNNTTPVSNYALAFEIDGQPVNIVNDVQCTRM